MASESFCIMCGSPLDKRAKKYCSRACGGKAAGNKPKSKEHRENIRQYSLNRSPETNKQIGETLKRKGIKPPLWWLLPGAEETRKKIAIANTGHKCSRETREKISRASKGNRSNLGRTGALASNWRGGLTNKNRCIRGQLDFKKWRNQVFERDEHTCQKCRERGGELNPHHIKNFSDNLELRFDTNNGVTFCRECHYGFHKEYGYSKNNNDQIKEFIAKTEVV